VACGVSPVLHVAGSGQTGVRTPISVPLSDYTIVIVEVPTRVVNTGGVSCVV